MTGMRIVAFAYACEPESGAEPGAGWMWARMLARLGESWVVTRENNRDAIEAMLPAIAERDRLHFEYVDLPAWARFWKRGLRGVHAYYVLWQIAALRRARALNDEQRFDLAWHLTFANAWIGSAAALLGTRFVYGPIGGGVKTPWRLVPALGLRGSLQELLRITVRGAARYGNPLARLSWRRADMILVQNPETREWLPKRHRAKVEIFPNAVLEAFDGPRAPRDPDGKVALFAARLSPWKGAALAIRVIARLPGWRLLVVGSGPDAARLRRLAGRLGVTDRLQYLGHVPRARFLQLTIGGADVLLFPSMHEDAGWVVAEARAAGLPVVALDRGGPPLLGAAVAKPGTLDETVGRLVGCVTAITSEEQRPVSEFGLDARSGQLEELVIGRGILSATPAADLSSLAEESGSRRPGVV
jgi:glycosyltransferase involved in cell wall biosynthesis